MLRRVLTLVMCFLAVFPQNICMCAAGTPCTDPLCYGTPEEHSPKDTTQMTCCGGCHHEEESDNKQPVQKVPPNHTHHPDHDPSCPTVNLNLSETIQQVSLQAEHFFDLVPTGEILSLTDQLPAVENQESISILFEGTPLYLRLLFLRN